jgi:signal transduction histidine kinase
LAVFWTERMITCRNHSPRKVDLASDVLLRDIRLTRISFLFAELIARCHLQMQMGKHRIDLERKFNERTLELHIRAVEAEEKRKEAEEQRRHQELLVDVTSHELRNPVSAILQNAQLVRENLKFLSTELTAVLDKDRGLMPTASLLTMLEEDVEALEAIYMMGMSQERIANDVLSLARIQLSTLE